MAVRFVVVGGGPAGIRAASVAARLGAEVTLVEKEVVGGAANLYDCVPSKAMIATGALALTAGRARAMGLEELPVVLDLEALAARVRSIRDRLASGQAAELADQGVRLVRGVARLVGPHAVEVEVAEDGESEADGGLRRGGVPGGSRPPSLRLEGDAILLATGSSPRVPPWAPVDGERVLTTRQAYPPPVVPEHLVVVGSGVTGVEFVHMFRSLGSAVTLVVSRQQVLPQKDPEVAAVLEADFLSSGVRLLKGARATGIERRGDEVRVLCDDGREVVGSHALLAVGSVPNSVGLGLERAGVAASETGHVPVNHHCQTNVPHIYAAGDLSGRLPLASVAAAQGRTAAEHAMGLHSREHRHLDYDKAASAIFTEPEIADVGLAEAEAFALGRKVRVTKVPFAANARALIDGDPRGFVKIVSDPATGVVLGGSIVGAHAAELVGVLALAVSAHLRVHDLAQVMFVHPALAEALADAAE